MTVTPWAAAPLGTPPLAAPPPGTPPLAALPPGTPPLAAGAASLLVVDDGALFAARRGAHLAAGSLRTSTGIEMGA
jgi:hypothetical protein